MNITGGSDEIFDAFQEFDHLSAPAGVDAAGYLVGNEPHKQATRGQLWWQWEQWKIAREHSAWKGAL